MTRNVIRPALLAIALLAPHTMAEDISAGLAPPGGAEPTPAHRSMVRHVHGRGARSYWLFEPAGPAPERAPVVVFLHGWLSINPGVYGAWIEHLVLKGNIVIFPRYQVDWSTRPAAFLPNSLFAIRDALDVLRLGPGHVRPDLARFALIGHSNGGNLAALLAASAAESGLPAPSSVVALMPGEVLAVPGPSLGQIPASTLLVVVAAEHDLVVGDGRARRIFAEAVAVPPDRKKYVLFRTDRHGAPWLVADHVAPTAASMQIDDGEGPFRSLQLTKAELNAMDRSGFWPLGDLTIEAGFAGKTLDEATGGGASFRKLGYWSDGRAVLEPIVGNDLAAIPHVVPSRGLRFFSSTPAAAATLDRAARQAAAVAPGLTAAARPE